MVISPSPLASPASHAETGALPSAMFTMVSSSFTVTSPSCPQSPTHTGGVGVAVGVRVGDTCKVGVTVAVGGAVSATVAVGGGVCVAGTVPVTVALAVAGAVPVAVGGSVAGLVAVTEAVGALVGVRT